MRALAKIHEVNPYVFTCGGSEMCVRYQPAESDSGVFGGNSNWRGPIWIPVNYLLVESLEKFHKYYGDDFTVECPTGSGRYLTLREIAAELRPPVDPHFSQRRFDVPSCFQWGREDAN
ncbi:MAG TPA: hypothetical protein VM574_09490 [Terrimicrobiaceae bacterium]|nr:hypothetical protein [Terrimicrobiaceae bacterium]